jgi:hypothetical protein
MNFEEPGRGRGTFPLSIWWVSVTVFLSKIIVNYSIPLENLNFHLSLLLQWPLLNVITLGPREYENINQTYSAWLNKDKSKTYFDDLRRIDHISRIITPTVITSSGFQCTV